MKEYRLFEIIKEAYETSTQACNRFFNTLNSIKWDNTFKADGEFYFIFGGFTLTAESLDPFNEEWKPSASFSDGSQIEF